MAATAADRLVECLLEWGVDTVFGLPGDGINGIMESLRQCQDRICFVQVRHEETAALMACGYAKLTGRLGVCVATSGPGGIHLLNGLYDAKMDGAAVLAITGRNIMTSFTLTPSRTSNSTSCSWMSVSTTPASWGRRMSKTSCSSPAEPPRAGMVWRM
jgi:thiamine pyrophosphate-dependent acetolactate synthase large subunit-like protein